MRQQPRQPGNQPPNHGPDEPQIKKPSEENKRLALVVVFLTLGLPVLAWIGLFLIEVLIMM